MRKCDHRGLRCLETCSCECQPCAFRRELRQERRWVCADCGRDDLPSPDHVCTEREETQ